MSAFHHWERRLPHVSPTAYVDVHLCQKPSPVLQVALSFGTAAGLNATLYLPARDALWLGQTLLEAAEQYARLQAQDTPVAVAEQYDAAQEGGEA